MRIASKDQAHVDHSSSSDCDSKYDSKAGIAWGGKCWGTACPIYGGGIPAFLKSSVALATAAALLIGCGSSAASSNASQATAVRQTVISLFRAEEVTRDAQQVCSLATPAEQRRLVLGANSTCASGLAAFFTLSDNRYPEAAPYRQQCFTASQAAILVAPVRVLGNTASFSFHPQGVPAQESFGGLKISCAGGSIRLARSAGRWLVASATGA